MIKILLKDKELRDYINKISRKKRLFENIYQYLIDERAVGNFYYNIGYYGNRPNWIWPDLKYTTKQKKYSKGYSIYPMLVETGRLRKSLLKGNPDHIGIVRSDFLLYGTNVEYASVHQEGFMNIPKRSFFLLEQEDFKRRIQNIMEDFVKDDGKID